MRSRKSIENADAVSQYDNDEQTQATKLDSNNIVGYFTLVSNKKKMFFAFVRNIKFL